MGALANISVLDSVAASIVFSPTSIDSAGIARWNTTTQAILAARRVLTQQLLLPKSGSEIVRLKLKTVVPIMDSIDSTKVRGSGIANVELVFPTYMSSVDRLDLLFYTVNSMAGSTLPFRAAVASYESPY